MAIEYLRPSSYIAVCDCCHCSIDHSTAEIWGRSDFIIFQFDFIRGSYSLLPVLGFDLTGCLIKEEY